MFDASGSIYTASRDGNPASIQSRTVTDFTALLPRSFLGRSEPEATRAPAVVRWRPTEEESHSALASVDHLPLPFAYHDYIGDPGR
jgi:hypothetical protein